MGQPPIGVQRPRVRRARVRRRPDLSDLAEYFAQAGTPLAEVATKKPEHAQRSGQPRSAFGAAGRFSRHQAPVAGEGAEPAEDRPLLLREQLIAPVHECTDRLVARKSRTGATGQQAEPVTQAGGDLFGAKQPGARGSELNG